MSHHSSLTQLWMAIVATASIAMSGCCGNPLGGLLQWGPGHKTPCESPHCATWADCHGYHSTCWDRWPDECQTCPPPVDPTTVFAPHLSPTPAPPVAQSRQPMTSESPVVVEDDMADEAEEMPNPGVLEEPQSRGNDSAPAEPEEEPTTYIRPVKAKASYYHSAKDRPKEQAHVAYLLPTPDSDAPSTSVKAITVRASISDEAQSLPKPEFPKTRLVR